MKRQSPKRVGVNCSKLSKEQIKALLDREQKTKESIRVKIANGIPLSSIPQKLKDIIDSTKNLNIEDEV